MDDNELAGFLRGGEDGFFVPREDGAQVDDLGVDASFEEGFGGALADGHGAAPANKGDVLPGAGDARFADGDIVLFDIGGGGVGAVVDEALGEEEDGGATGFEDGIE